MLLVQIEWSKVSCTTQRQYPHILQYQFFLLFAIVYIEENNNLHFALHLNSANDILIKQAETAAGLDGDARKRRLASEKSMVVLTNGDVKKAKESKSSGGKNGPKPHSKRTDKKKLNINKNYDEYE